MEKTFKELKAAHQKLEDQLQSAQQMLNSLSTKNVKPKKQKPEQKKARTLDPLILKLIKESYNLRLENLLKMQESLLVSFQQHPITLEYQRRESIEEKYLELLASYEKSKEHLNQFHLEARKSYFEWLKLIGEEEKSV